PCRWPGGTPWPPQSAPPRGGPRSTSCRQAPPAAQWQGRRTSSGRIFPPGSSGPPIPWPALLVISSWHCSFQSIKNPSACSLPGMVNPQRPKKASGGLRCGASPRGFLGAAPAPFQVFQGVQLPRPFPLLLKDGVVEALHHQVAHIAPGIEDVEHVPPVGVAVARRPGFRELPSAKDAPLAHPVPVEGGVLAVDVVHAVRPFLQLG